MERIEAMELLGETFVDKTKDVAGAIKYWKRAMEERYEGICCAVALLISRTCLFIGRIWNFVVQKLAANPYLHILFKFPSIAESQG